MIKNLNGKHGAPWDTLFGLGLTGVTREVGRAAVISLIFATFLAMAATAKAKDFAARTQVIRVHENDARVSIGQDVKVLKEDVTQGVVVVGADAWVEGRVEGDVVVVGGSANIQGEVTGSVVTVLGSTKLGDEARIEGDAVVVGGRLDSGTGAVVNGEKTAVGFGVEMPKFKRFFEWIGAGPMMGRWLPLGMNWAWGVAGILLVIYGVLAVLFPRPATLCVDLLEQRSAASFFTGVLTFMLVGPVLLLLLISVAGILVIPFVLCGIVAVLLFGKMVSIRYLGEQFGRQLGGGVMVQPLVALATGGLLVAVLYTVPILGLVTWGLLTPLGAGAVVLAISSGLSRPRVGVAGAGLGVGGGVTTREAGLGEPPLPGGENRAAAGVDPLLLPRVGFWRRFWAACLDVILVGLATAIVQQPLAFLFGLLVYHIGMWGWKGTTIGGTILGIRCYRTTGAPMDYGVATVRGISAIFSFLVLGLGFLWAGWDRENQSWHDKIAGTMVVRMPRGTPLL